MRFCPDCGEPLRVPAGRDARGRRRWRATQVVPFGGIKVGRGACPVNLAIEPVGAAGPGGKPGVFRSARLSKHLAEREAGRRAVAA